MPKYRHRNSGSVIATTEQDFRAVWEDRGFESVDDAIPEPPNLNDLTRDELNAHAENVGVSNPESLPNKAAVIEAIKGARGES